MNCSGRGNEALIGLGGRHLPLYFDASGDGRKIHLGTTVSNWVTAAETLRNTQTVAKGTVELARQTIETPRLMAAIITCRNTSPQLTRQSERRKPAA